MTKEELLQALQNAYVVEQENENLLNDYRVDNSSPYELTTEHYEGDVCCYSDEELEEDEKVWEIQAHTPKEFGIFLKENYCNRNRLNGMKMKNFSV